MLPPFERELFLSLSSIFYPAAEKLMRLERLSQDDIDAFLALPHRLKWLDLGGYIVREDDRIEHCCVLLEGIAIRHKVTNGGNRQIVSIQIPGDFVDLQNSLLDIADHSVQTLTKAHVALIPVTAIEMLIAQRPALGRALWRDTLIDAAIFREWIVNVGRRDAASRIAHLLCELAVRLAFAGMAEDHCYKMPLTQEQLADAVGLTPIHVNRTLRDLERQNLIRRDKRTMCILDWPALEELGDFNDRYLHPNLTQDPVDETA